MSKDNVIQFENPEQFQHDMLTEVLRNGAQRLLASAVEAEVEDFLANHNQHTTETGQRRFVRNGYLPERKIITGIGDVSVKAPRVRDRVFAKDGIRFGSSIIPKYLRRSGDMNQLIPLLYLKGVSSGDFVEALVPLVGEQAKGISAGVVSRLKSKWEGEYTTWCQRDLGDRHYVYWWVDGIYLQARMEDAKDCVLVIMGATKDGVKELVAIEAGFRESKAAWQELLRSLKRRGLKQGPKLAVGDGALGFWGALTEEYPEAKAQCCWFHKMGNILDKLPKTQQPKAKTALQEIWMSATRKEATQAFNQFIDDYQLKYPKATACLEKDKAELLNFYDFPAEHWPHLRTTNPIESTFATVRHRTKKSKGCFSRKTIMTMVFKLCQSAEKHWNRLRGYEKLAKVITGVKFVDGVVAENEVTVDELKASA